MEELGRRDFLFIAGGTCMLGVAPLAAGCAADQNVRDDQVRAGGAAAPLDPVADAILRHASRAASGHNTQPWRVRILNARHWIVEPDLARRLPAVDPEDRELLRSLGAFVENLVLAAGALGQSVETRIVSGGTGPSGVEVHLAPCAPTGYPVQRLETRRTLRNGYLDSPLSPAEVTSLLAAAGLGAAFFPMDSREGRWLQEATVAAFRAQTYRDDAQRELSTWIRFGNPEARAKADGLTTGTMEIDGFGGWYLRTFMSASSVMTPGFREKGIDGTAGNARRGAGYLVLVGSDAGDASCIDAGRRFERMCLGLREAGLAAHPMSQVIEEEPWSGAIAGELGLGGRAHFVVRIGRVDRYPPPVSLRRPVCDFVVT